MMKQRRLSVGRKRKRQRSEDQFVQKSARTDNLLQKAPREPPSKFVTTYVDVQLACRLLFVDLEGLNDGGAVKTIVPQVNPRKMVSCMTINGGYS